MSSGGAKNGKQDPIVSALLKRTETWGATIGLYPKGKEPKGKMTKVSKEIHNIISGAKFGCQEDAVRMICSNLLGLLGQSPLPKAKKGDQSIKYQPGVVIIPSSGEFQGEPCLLLESGGRCVGIDGKEARRGNLPSTSSGTRLATEVEVIHLVNTLKEKYPDKLELALLLVEGY